MEPERPDAGVIDFHNHLMPGVDDGARDIDEARAALSAFAGDGVSAIITTPHIEARNGATAGLVRSRLDVMDPHWERLAALARAEFPSLAVHRGAEVRLDVPDPDLSDPRLRLDGGRFALVEFAYFTVPPRSARVLARIVDAGFTPVIAHPERYAGILRDADTVREWRAAGAFMQVNGGSLLGRYGDPPRAAGAWLLESGLADYLSSDYHARGQPLVARYRQALVEAGGEEQARLLLEVNPARLLAGEDPIAVPPLERKRGLLAWLAEVFR